MVRCLLLEWCVSLAAEMLMSLAMVWHLLLIWRGPLLLRLSMMHRIIVLVGRWMGIERASGLLLIWVLRMVCLLLENGLVSGVLVGWHRDTSPTTPSEPFPTSTSLRHTPSHLTSLTAPSCSRATCIIFHYLSILTAFLTLRPIPPFPLLLHLLLPELFGLLLLVIVAKFLLRGQQLLIKHIASIATPLGHKIVKSRINELQGALDHTTGLSMQLLLHELCLIFATPPIFFLRFSFELLLQLFTVLGVQLDRI